MQKAKDIMTTDIISVKDGTPVEELARILWENKISGVPVLDDNDRLIGVATENDLIDQAKNIHIPSMITILDSVIFLESAKKTEDEIKKMTGSKVRDICAGELITVEDDTSLAEIATIMAEKKVHTLPVLRDGELVGIVGKSDIIRTLAQK